MEEEQVCFVEILTARQDKAEELKQMLLRAARLESEMPGIIRTWVVQDQHNPCEIAQVVIADAERFEQVLSTVRESAWHKEMALQAPALRMDERTRVVVGPYLF